MIDRHTDAALTFVHMSDPHVGHHAEAEATFARALEDAARLSPRPEFILVTGDLTEGELAHYRAFRRIARGSRIPVVTLPGNHDVGNRLSDRSLALIDRYRDQIGRDRHAFSAGPPGRQSRFILLNSLFLRAPSRVLPRRSARLADEVDAQWEFLERELSCSVCGPRPARSVFICFHHVPYAVHVNGPALGYLPISRSARRRIFDLCRRWNVQAVLSGHAHWSREVLVGRTALITTPSVSFNNPFGPGGKLPLGFRVVTTLGEHLFHRYKSLDLAGLPSVRVIGVRQHASDGRWVEQLSGYVANTRALAVTA